MNTIIIEHADNSTTELLKQLAKALGLPVKTKKEKVQEGVITNPILIEAIENYESGKTKTVPFDKEAFLKKIKDA